MIADGKTRLPMLQDFAVKETSRCKYHRSVVALRRLNWHRTTPTPYMSSLRQSGMGAQYEPISYICGDIQNAIPKEITCMQVTHSYTCSVHQETEAMEP